MFPASAGPQPKDWTNILFLTFSPIMAVPVLILYTCMAGFEWWMPLLFLGMYALVGLSVCAGYHRYFSHCSYRCTRVVQMFYAIFGAMAGQNSILAWSSFHRRHHAYAEEEWDPYSITRGFWWAHFIWIFYRSPYANRFENVRDLAKNPVVQWQNRWYKWLFIGAGFGVPTLIGALLGDAFAGLLWGGFLRVVFVHHSTFFVNSLAHRFGSKTYDEESSARDNWAVAMLTFGEGYHSFHHRFPSDFRNGIRWFAWDPAKWFIQSLKMLGLATDLRVIEAPLIEKTRMKAMINKVEERLATADHQVGDEMRARMHRARESFDLALASWRAQAELQQQGLRSKWKKHRDNYRIHLAAARREWRLILAAYKQLCRAEGVRQ